MTPGVGVLKLCFLFVNRYGAYLRHTHEYLTISVMKKKVHNVDTSGLYYKHMTIINYAPGVVNKLDALLTDNARVIIYDRHVFIVQATGDGPLKLFYFVTDE